jgi:hypothetical protein
MMKSTQKFSKLKHCELSRKHRKSLGLKSTITMFERVSSSPSTYISCSKEAQHWEQRSGAFEVCATTNFACLKPSAHAGTKKKKE